MWTANSHGHQLGGFVSDLKMCQEKEVMIPNSVSIWKVWTW